MCPYPPKEQKVRYNQMPTCLLMWRDRPCWKLQQWLQQRAQDGNHGARCSEWVTFTFKLSCLSHRQPHMLCAGGRRRRKCLTIVNESSNAGKAGQHFVCYTCVHECVSLHMGLWVYTCMCVYTCVCCVSVCVHEYVSIVMSVSIYVSIHVYMSMFVYRLCMCLYLCTYEFVYVYVLIHVCTSISTDVCISMYIYAYVSIYVWVFVSIRLYLCVYRTLCIYRCLYLSC